MKKATVRRVMGGVSADEARVLSEALRCFVAVHDLVAGVWFERDPESHHETLNSGVFVSAESKRTVQRVADEAYRRVSPAIRFIQWREDYRRAA